MCLIVDAMFLDLLNCVSHLTTAVMCSQVFLIVCCLLVYAKDHGEGFPDEGIDSH